MAAKKWSEQDVNTLTETYTPDAEDFDSDAAVESLMETLGRSKRQVIGKLVHMGVYEAPEKAPKQPKDEGPTKGEILTEIKSYGFEIEGFDNATKPALSRLRDFVAANSANDSEDSEVA